MRSAQSVKHSAMNNWEKIKEIFSNALQLKGDERESYMQQACGSDEDLYREVRSLIEADQQASILDRPLDRFTREIFDSTREPGEIIGRYKILKELGEGGMGSVYLAERADGQFEQNVAIKILKSGFHTEDQLKRFIAERQILATLNHEHIARLYDGGVTDNGQPWFAMELIEGSPIDEYCRKHQPNLKERLSLFMEVCDAVQYAHRKLIVHGDIKPSNILVTDSGQVKLVDFGISKILKSGEDLGDDNEKSVSQFIPVTPAYASPEQLQGGQITTSSDIYQLGLVLYELITGRGPFQLDELTHQEIKQVICNTSPPAAGDILSENEKRDELEKWPVKARDVRGDLDAILMKAIDPEPDQRYHSAEQIVADIQRHFQKQPVIARDQTWTYQLNRFFARHKTGTASIAAVLTLLVVYAISVTSHSKQTEEALEQARLEAEKSEQIANFMMGMFEAGDPYENLGDTVTARVLLDRGIQYAEELDSQPTVQARMFNVVGRVHRELGEYEKAYPLLKKSLLLKKEHQPSEEIAIADSYYRLGTVMHHMGEYRESNEYFENALDIYGKHPKHESAEYASSLFAHANVRNVHRDPETALKLHKQAYEMRRKLFGEYHADVAASSRSLGFTYHLLEQPDTADHFLKESYDIYHEIYDPHHPSIAELLTVYARVVERNGDSQRAIEMLKDAVEIRSRAFGEFHTKTGTSQKALADLYRNNGNFETAEEIYLDLLWAIENRLGGNNPLYRPVVQALGKLYLETDRFEEAEPRLRQTVNLLESVLNESHPRVLSARRDLAGCLIELFRLDEANELLAENLNVLTRQEDDQYLDEKVETLRKLVKLHQSWDRFEDASEYEDQLEQVALAARN